MIKVTCASCDKVYQLPDAAAGRRARCKACGEAMTVPDAPDELFDDSPPEGTDLTKLYAAGDSSEIVDQSVAVDDPAGFNPEVGFQQSPKQSSSPGLPKVYLFAGAGGALVLILIVVVVVVLMSSGAGDDENDGAGALAFDPNASVPIGEMPIPSTGDTSDPDTTGVIEPELPVTQPEDPGTADEVAEPEVPVAVDPEVAGPEVDEPVAVEENVGQDALSVTAPHNSNYAILLPEGLDLISQTRVAVRTRPQDDGTWLSMEVHKLSGLDRREISPVASDNSTVLLRGRRIAMPAGVTVSDLVTDHFTAKRLLYPKQPGMTTQRVEYVIKDGPYLISVLGRFPASDEGRLAMLDEAAKSVQPIKGD